MSDIVSEEVKQIFQEVLKRAGDCYTCLKFEEVGIRLKPSDIPEFHQGYKTHRDIHALPVNDRIDIYIKKVDWSDREAVAKALRVINHYLEVFFGVGPNPKWVKDEIRERLLDNGLAFENGKLVRSSQSKLKMPK